MVGEANLIKVKYQSNSPGTHWIKVSNANKLRDKALANQLEENLKENKKSMKMIKKLSKEFDEAVDKILGAL